MEGRMAELAYRTALIVGVGGGLSASLARTFTKAGMKVALAARRANDLAALAKEIGGKAFACDATKHADVAKLFADVEGAFGAPDVVVYNASYRTRGPFVQLDPAEVEKTLIVSAFAGFLVAQEAAKRMLPSGHGAILFTGASASVKGYAQSAPFAMGKFALRGLAQSMARELSPQGLHIAHIVIDGGIRSASRADPPDKPDSMLSPDAIAQTYLDLLRQQRSAWAWEIELRPWVERF
jgi:NAD(P)-dependent dehydrogenase (short-subunit alcohol dehydrogenase family)